MNRIIAFFITLLFISISVYSATDCNMPVKADQCSNMLHLDASSSQNTENCCSISAMSSEKEISFQKHIDNSLSLNLQTETILPNIQYLNKIRLIYNLNFAFPSPLQTIKFLR